MYLYRNTHHRNNMNMLQEVQLSFVKLRPSELKNKHKLSLLTCQVKESIPVKKSLTSCREGRF